MFLASQLMKVQSPTQAKKSENPEVTVDDTQTIAFLKPNINFVFRNIRFAGVRFFPGSAPVIVIVIVIVIITDLLINLK